MNHPDQQDTSADLPDQDPATLNTGSKQLSLFPEIPPKCGYSGDDIHSLGETICSANTTRTPRRKTNTESALDDESSSPESAPRPPRIIHYGFIEDPLTGIIPTPENDVYLQGLPLSVISSGFNEKLMTLPLADDLISYYQDIAIDIREEDVIQVNPRVDRERGRFGYPNTNALIQMRRAVKRGEQPPFTDGIYIPAFTSIQTTSIAEGIGLFSTLKHTANAEVQPNDKAHFRQHARKYRYNVLPGNQIESEEDYKVVGTIYAGSPAWLKLSRSSGGDGVCHIPNLNLETLRDKVDVMKQRVMKSFRNNRFTRSTRDSIWKTNEELPNPEHLSLVLEVHAPILGPNLLNGSSVMVVAQSDKPEGVPDVTIPYLFRQITGPQGEFRGSRNYNIHEDTRLQEQGIDPKHLESLIAEQHLLVADYLAKELNFYGIVGLDFMVVIESGEPKVYCMEVNARAPVSAVPRMLMNTLGAQCMHQQNVSCPDTITSVAGFEKHFQFEDYNPVRGTPVGNRNMDKGMIIPLALKTIFSRDSDGNLKVEYPSNELKIGIFANSFDTIDYWCERMRSAGILFPESRNA